LMSLLLAIVLFVLIIGFTVSQYLLPSKSKKSDMNDEITEKEICKTLAAFCAYIIKEQIGDNPVPKTALVLGTGWGDAVEFEDAVEIPFRELPGFQKLPDLEGHARRVIYGKLGGEPVLALRGRVHLNESYVDDAIYRMVRVQIQMLLELGVEKLILTCAAGSLGGRAEVGQVVVIDGFVSFHAPKMPMFGGEFRSPDDTLDEGMMNQALYASTGIIPITKGGHIMLRGPFFEGRRYDKKLLAQTGATVVGMSVLPEACIAALYGAKVVGLAFVTNDDKEEHSHEENQKRVKERSGSLGAFLTKLVGLISHS